MPRTSSAMRCPKNLQQWTFWPTFLCATPANHLCRWAYLILTLLWESTITIYVMFEMDLLSAERLELWRLPSEARLVSDRLSNVNVFKYDDPDKRFSRLFVREMLEVPIRSVEDWYVVFSVRLSLNLVKFGCVFIRTSKSCLFVPWQSICWIHMVCQSPDNGKGSSRGSMFAWWTVGG